MLIFSIMHKDGLSIKNIEPFTANTSPCNQSMIQPSTSKGGKTTGYIRNICIYLYVDNTVIWYECAIKIGGIKKPGNTKTAKNRIFEHKRTKSSAGEDQPRPRQTLIVIAQFNWIK